MCVCEEGYLFNEGHCLSPAECPVEVGTFSDWSPWSDCSVTCSEGIHTRSRMCMGPGKCPDEPTMESQTCGDVADQCPILSISPGEEVAQETCYDMCGDGGECDQCNSGAEGTTGFCCSGATRTVN